LYHMLVTSHRLLYTVIYILHVHGHLLCLSYSTGVKPHTSHTIVIPGQK
jgi:hypothetical protein